MCMTGSRPIFRPGSNPQRPYGEAPDRARRGGETHRGQSGSEPVAVPDLSQAAAARVYAFYDSSFVVALYLS